MPITIPGHPAPVTRDIGALFSTRAQPPTPSWGMSSKARPCASSQLVE
jgi:hypothetical protein